jgi:16S rRNA (guanine527-N7)-methyltransferase
LTKDELWLRTIALKNGLTITDIQLKKLSRFVELLKEWNQRINLISRKDEENIWPNHLLLSIAFLFKIELRSGARILDLGTGGGLPGIPLSILLADVDFVLLDSIQKKVAAVKNMVDALELPNASVFCSRAEDVSGMIGYKFAFDAVIARAVSGLENLVAWGTPFLKRQEGLPNLSILPNEKIRLTRPAIIAMKGGETKEEMEKTRRLFPKAQIHSMDLVFKGGEILHNTGKRLIIVENE